MWNPARIELKVSFNLSYIFVKADDSGFTILQPKITFRVIFEISYFVWSPKISFDFSIKSGSICLLKPQDKSKKFTNFETFLIVGWAEKEENMLKLGHCPRPISRWVISTQQWTGRHTQTATIHCTALYTIQHVVQFNCWTLQCSFSSQPPINVGWPQIA